MRSRVIIFFSTFVLILGTTIVIFLWAKGYTFDGESRKIAKVGMISVKSQPDGARIFLDGTLVSATNTTLSGLKGGRHQLRIEKEGFSPWEKTVPVKEEMVTFVEAALVPKSVEIRPLTTNGVFMPVANHSRDKIYFISKTDSSPEMLEKSGIWALDLNSSIFNIFKNGATLIFPDTLNLIYSAAESLKISPSDNQMLIKMNEKGYYLALLGGSQTPIATSTAQPTEALWEKENLTRRQNVADKNKLPPDLHAVSTDPETLWSPDDKKFLYKVKNKEGDSWKYSVRNLSDPLGVGEAEEYLVATVALSSNTRFTWYPDSKRLLMSECGVFKKDTEKTAGSDCISGSIHLIDIDGTNNVQIYSGSMASDIIFPTPDGSKLIFLTTFNETAPPNLYAISLR